MFCHHILQLSLRHLKNCAKIPTKTNKVLFSLDFHRKLGVVMNIKSCESKSEFKLSLVTSLIIFSILNSITILVLNHHWYAGNKEILQTFLVRWTSSSAASVIAISISRDPCRSHKKSWNNFNAASSEFRESIVASDEAKTATRFSRHQS